MHRVMFSILPNDAGWQLYEGATGRHWFLRATDAIEAAGSLAWSHHDRTGSPTAVIMDTRDGDSVMLARHG